MKSVDVRKKYIEFFKKRGHIEIPSAPLVPENDRTTLFTSSGMQPLIPYLLGTPHPAGKRLVNSQKSFRSQDIDEVGDNRHTTFFEMLGNWSLGDYFKKKQLEYFFTFLTDENEGLGLKPDRLYVSIFDGDQRFKALHHSKKNLTLDPDVESMSIWKDLFKKAGIDHEVDSSKEKPDIRKGRIFYYGVEKNWWSRSGPPDKMPVGEIGGPDSEVFYDFGKELKFHENSSYKDEPCHPNCDCGRFLEIGNSVFIQYRKTSDGKLEELPQKNVDFGGGLERMVAATNDNPDIFQTDFFVEAIKSLEAIKKFGEGYSENPKLYRIIVDHLRAAIFMVADGVTPSNKAQGYVLRRLLRRSMVYARKLGMEGDEWLSNTLPSLAQPYIRSYPYIDENIPQINEEITREVDKFRKTINEGIQALKKIFGRAIGGVDPENLPKGMKFANNVIRVDGNEVFKIYETYGLTPEISQEIMTGWGLAFDEETMRECREAMKKHQDLSRTAAKGMFKGGLADASIETTKLHTATHLLHEVLHRILGEHIQQKGSNITQERLRFDFSYSSKLTPEEIKNIEDLVNEKIKENLPVSFEILDKEKALASGARAFFGERYGEKVKIYSIGNFSREICGGPHVEHTGLLGHFKIIKEESAGSGIRRIYAVVETR